MKENPQGKSPKGGSVKRVVRVRIKPMLRAYSKIVNAISKLNVEEQQCVIKAAEALTVVEQPNTGDDRP